MASRGRADVACCFRALLVITSPLLPKPLKCASISVGYRVDSLVVGAGETVGLEVAGRNDSSSTVTAMHVKIKHLTSWSAESCELCRKRTLASMVVIGSSLGALEAPAEVGTERRRNASFVAISAREDLQRKIAAGTGTRYELFVPEDALQTVKTDTIEVKHFLVVKLKTKGCSSPEISAPLQVQRPLVFAAEAQPGAGSPVPPLPETASSQDATMNVEVGGNDDGMPASVPR